MKKYQDRLKQTDTTHSTDTAAAFIQHFINDCLLSKYVPICAKGSWMIILPLNSVIMNERSTYINQMLEKE